LAQLRREKAQLEQTLEQEQEQQISKLTKKIGRLEKDVLGKQSTLEKLRREKIDLENTLEQEQEMLVNKLWKRIEKVEQEKRELEAKLGATPPPSPSDRNSPALLTSRIAQLSAEVDKLRRMLQHTETQNREKVQQITDEERMLREENLRLQRRLLRETERREQLSRQLSESESSLEMDEERQFNERARFAGSPVSYSPSPTRRSLSPSPALLTPSAGFTPPSPLRGRTSSCSTSSKTGHAPCPASSQHSGSSTEHSPAQTRRHTLSGGLVKQREKTSAR
jgi:coiled-coil domain-containing protein 6